MGKGFGSRVAGFSVLGLLACTPPSPPESRPIGDPLPTQDVSLPPDSGTTPDSGTPDSGTTPNSGTPPVDGEKEPPEHFTLSGTPELLLSPEGYYATSVTVASDGTLVLAPGSLGREGFTHLLLGRYTAQGQPLWERTLSGIVESPWLATSAEGDIALWCHLGYGADYGSGPTKNISHGLARYSTDGRLLWVREAGCYEANPRMDAAGNVTVLQMAGCQSEAQTEFLERFTPSGERAFIVLVARNLKLIDERHVVGPDGAMLVAGRGWSSDGASLIPKWIQLGAEGTQRASGAVQGVMGTLEPLQLTPEGQYLALLHVDSGSGSFAGQPVECIRGADGWCVPLLVSGNVDGREDSVGMLPRDERILWISPSRELVTVARDVAGTGSILRRRSSSARLLGTYALPSLSPARSDAPNVSVTQVVPMPDSSLLVLGTLVGDAELGGTRVHAGWSRLFLLRVVAFTPPAGIGG